MAMSIRPTGRVPHEHGRACGRVRIIEPGGVYLTDLIAFQHFRFLQRLHGIHLASVHFLDKANLRHGSHTMQEDTHDPALPLRMHPFR